LEEEEKEEESRNTRPCSIFLLYLEFFT